MAGCVTSKQDKLMEEMRFRGRLVTLEQSAKKHVKVDGIEVRYSKREGSVFSDCVAFFPGAGSGWGTTVAASRCVLEHHSFVFTGSPVLKNDTTMTQSLAKGADSTTVKLVRSGGGWAIHITGQTRTFVEGQ